MSGSLCRSTRRRPPAIEPSQPTSDRTVFVKHRRPLSFSCQADVDGIARALDKQWTQPRMAYSGIQSPDTKERSG